jgi:hypothetical protein
MRLKKVKCKEDKIHLEQSQWDSSGESDEKISWISFFDSELTIDLHRSARFRPTVRARWGWNGGVFAPALQEQRAKLTEPGGLPGLSC